MNEILAPYAARVKCGDPFCDGDTEIDPDAGYCPACQKEAEDRARLYPKAYSVPPDDSGLDIPANWGTPKGAKDDGPETEEEFEMCRRALEEMEAAR